MKKVIRKFWAVALVVVMLSTLFVMSTPASAVPLTFNLDIFMPSFVPGTAWTEFPGTDIVDFAVSPDGMTVYAALQVPAGDQTILMKSTMGGAGWVDLTSAANNRVPVTLDSIDFVAISPDNPNVVVVLDAGGTDTVIAAAASTDGGLNFYDMGTIQDSAVNDADAVYDLDVSPVGANNIYFVAIAGSDTAYLVQGDNPAIYYYNFGASVGQWRDAVDDFGSPAVTPPGLTPPWLAGTEIDNFRAVKFSPDGSLVALSEQIGTATEAGFLRLHVISLSAHRWDTDLALTGYPITVDTVAIADGTFAVNEASIAVGPEYSGSEQETQITFVGASIASTSSPTTGDTGGIYRIDESGEVRDIKTNTGINSIDYDGSTVIAGAYMDNNVYRVTDPMAGSPSAASARSMKRIGIDSNDGAGNDNVIIHMAGANVFGAKIGDASGLSKSTDLGNTWNDFSLMDSSNMVIDDILIAPDGSVKYMVTNDWAAGEGEVSIYRVVGFSSQRVLCIDQTPSAGALNLKLRGIPGDSNVLYAFDEAGSDIYVSTDGGVTRWSKKTTYPGGNIQDLAVESNTICYAATGQLVYKSTSSGSSWGAGVDTLIGIFQMISLGDGKLVVGGNIFYVGWSTDGGATWLKNGAPIPGGNFMVAATGLAATDYLFAAPANGAGAYRANPVPFTEFKSMNLPVWPGTETNQGLVLNSGVLYVLGSEPIGTMNVSLAHTLAPTVPGSHPGGMWGTIPTYVSYATVQNGPVLPATATTIPVLRAAATSTSIQIYTPLFFLFGPSVFYYDDIVSLPSAAPVLLGPADDALFKIISPMLADAELVNFTWRRAAPQITSYLIWCSLDEAFNELVFAPPIVVPSNLSPIDIVSYVGARNQFQPGRSYYWRVQANTPFSGTFSETRSFTIAPSAATVPEIASPANGATITSTKPSFSWSPVTGTTKYEFQMDTGTLFTAPMVSEQLATTAIMPNVTLEAGKTYFWRVRALEPVPSDWSTISNFTVAVPPPPPPTPTQTIIAPPTITITQQPPVTFTIPTAETTEISPAYIWAIIIIGAVLVIAVIVLIVRTRRQV